MMNRTPSFLFFIALYLMASQYYRERSVTGWVHHKTFCFRRRGHRQDLSCFRRESQSPTIKPIKQGYRSPGSLASLTATRCDRENHVNNLSSAVAAAVPEGGKTNSSSAPEFLRDPGASRTTDKSTLSRESATTVQSKATAVAAFLIRVSYDGRGFTGWSSANDGPNGSSNDNSGDPHSFNPKSHRDRDWDRHRNSTNSKVRAAKEGSGRRGRSRQPPGTVRSVQGSIRRCVSKVYGNQPLERVVVDGCSRTDRGVHATGILALVYCYHDCHCCDDDANHGHSVRSHGDEPRSVVLHEIGDDEGRDDADNSIQDDKNDTRPTSRYCRLIAPVPMPLSRLVFTLNRMLPADVRIVSIAGIDACAAATIVAAAVTAANAASDQTEPADDEPPMSLSSPATMHRRRRSRPRPPLSLQSFLINFRKTYRYQFSTGPLQDPMQRRTAWHVIAAGTAPSSSEPLHFRGVREDEDYALCTVVGQREAAPQLDWDAMRHACCLLEGTHDFRAFQGSPRGSELRDPISVCTLETVRLEIDRRQASERSNEYVLDNTYAADDSEGCCFALHITGDRFLYKMVRLIAGCLVDVGRGRIRVAELEEALRSGSRQAFTRPLQCAPAHGLTLIDVCYDSLLDLEWQ